MNLPKRGRTVDLATAAVNRSLGQLGCNYCRQYKPAEQVREKRNRLSGQKKMICTSCEEGRKLRKGPVQK